MHRSSMQLREHRADLNRVRVVKHGMIETRSPHRRRERGRRRNTHIMTGGDTRAGERDHGGEVPGSGRRREQNAHRASPAADKRVTEAHCNAAVRAYSRRAQIT